MILNHEYSGSITTFLKRTIESISIPSLAEKSDYSLNQFSSIIDEFIEKDYKIEKPKTKITKDFVKARNCVNHGSTTTKMNKDTVNAYRIIRLLAFSMQLTRIGFSEKEITECIKSVFELR